MGESEFWVKTLFSDQSINALVGDTSVEYQEYKKLFTGRVIYNMNNNF